MMASFMDSRVQCFNLMKVLLLHLKLFLKMPSRGCNG